MIMVDVGEKECKRGGGGWGRAREQMAYVRFVYGINLSLKKSHHGYPNQFKWCMWMSAALRIYTSVQIQTHA